MDIVVIVQICILLIYELRYVEHCTEKLFDQNEEAC